MVRLTLLAGYGFICFGWAAAFSLLGVVAFGVGAVLVVGGAIGGGVASRSISRLLVPLGIGALVFFAFPVVAGAAFWAGRGFQGPDSGSTGIQTPTGRP